jgi:hypothetical protein
MWLKMKQVVMVKHLAIYLVNDVNSQNFERERLNLIKL